MSSCDQARKSANFSIHRSLLITSLSPLSRPPGCLVNCPAGYPLENPESYPDRNPGSYSAGYPEENSESYPGSRGEGSSADCSADSPANRPGSNSESNLPDNPENNLPSYSESCWVDCPAGCLEDYLDRAGRDASTGSGPRLCPVRGCSPHRNSPSEPHCDSNRESDSESPRPSARESHNEVSPPSHSPTDIARGTQPFGLLDIQHDRGPMRLHSMAASTFARALLFTLSLVGGLVGYLLGRPNAQRHSNRYLTRGVSLP